MMTTLQIVLAIVGVVLIAIIVIYNLLQERRFRKEAEKMFSHRREDVMLGESVRTESSNRRAETHIHLTDEASPAPEVQHVVDEADAPLPSMDAMRQPASASILSAIESIGPSLSDEVFTSRPTVTVDSAEPKAAPRPQPAVKPIQQPIRKPVAAPQLTPQSAAAASPARAQPTDAAVDAKQPGASNLDAATEYIARLKFVAPTMANFGPLLATLRRIGKPVRAFGRRADGAWEALSSHPRSAFDQVEFGLQLADRSGALSQDHLDAFSRALYEFAAEEGGAVSCPDKQEALDRARDLDLFCMDVDVLIGLNVVSADSRPFTSEAMHGLALEAGLSLEPAGSFHARDAFGHTLFTLANQGEEPFPRDGRGLTTHGVTLLFDVPRVADGLAVFDRMTQLGFDLAARLEGRLVDDNSRAVSEESLNRDRARLMAFYQRMEARAIPAGGERSLRLFV
ncbi:MAG: cell division protein ZipA C-terminal FtsZ-binding domain-containing protein [Pseudomonadota bacterium]|nr:cell division protein ZipA C-terminal FtsZ-binding domain-containing protein [Pseudomonadota bacterium]